MSIFDAHFGLNEWKQLPAPNELPKLGGGRRIWSGRQTGAPGVLLSAADQNNWEQARLQGSRVLGGTVSARVKSERRALQQPQRRLTRSETAAIAAEYAAGASTYELAESWDINRDTVTLALKKMGVEIREHGRLTPQQLEEAQHLQAEGWSLNRLGARFGIDPKTMKKRLQLQAAPAPAASATEQGATLPSRHAADPADGR